MELKAGSNVSPLNCRRGGWQQLLPSPVPLLLPAADAAAGEAAANGKGGEPQSSKGSWDFHIPCSTGVSERHNCQANSPSSKWRQRCGGEGTQSGLLYTPSNCMVACPVPVVTAAGKDRWSFREAWLGHGVPALQELKSQAPRAPGSQRCHPGAPYSPIGLARLL